ncbi:hypothetical protein EU537_12635, partial [Candidatus Thorarchaeota archaeon]
MNCTEEQVERSRYGKQESNKVVSVLFILLLLNPFLSVFWHVLHESNGGLHSKNKNSEGAVGSSNNLGMLPSSTNSIMISGGVIGSFINATLTFCFKESISDESFKLGFNQEYLEIRDGLFSSPVLGLGYDEMREYPYFYTESGELFDYRKKPAPSWASRRFYPAWTEEAKAGYYLGPISEENISRATLAGDVVEFENLTVYYADSSSRRVGPQLITVGVEFSLEDGDWSIEHIVNASDDVGVIIETQQIHVPLQHFE